MGSQKFPVEGPKYRSTVSATAEVSDVSDGFTSRITVNYGGAGFKLASIITSTNLPTLITGAVDAVNTLV